MTKVDELENEALLRALIQISKKCVTEEGMALPLNVFVISTNAAVFGIRFLDLQGDTEGILEHETHAMEMPLHVLTVDANGVGRHDTIEFDMRN